MQVIQTEEIWTFFIDVLDGKIQLPTNPKVDVMDALIEAVKHVKDHGHYAVLKKPFGDETLEQRLRRGTRKVALEATSYWVLTDSFKVLSKLGVEEEYILNTIKKLLETRGDCLGPLSRSIHTELMRLGTVKVKPLLFEWARSDCDKLRYGALSLLESVVMEEE